MGISKKDCQISGGNCCSCVFFTGILLIILGTLAIGAAVFTTLLSVFILGCVLLAGGIFEIFHSFYSKTWGELSVELLVGVLYAVVGGLLIAKPVQGAASLTLLLALVFFVGGIFKSLAAIFQRNAGWGWLLFSGLISIALGALIWSEWPESSLWIIGLFIGIDLIFSGWTLLMLGWVGSRSDN